MLHITAYEVIAICKTELLLVFIHFRCIKFLIVLPFPWWEVTLFKSFTNFCSFLTVKESKFTGEKEGLQGRRKYISGNLDLKEKSHLLSVTHKSRQACDKY